MANARPSLAPEMPSATPGAGPMFVRDSIMRKAAPNRAMPMPSCTLRRSNPATTPAPSQAPSMAAAMMVTSVVNSTSTMVM